MTRLGPAKSLPAIVVALPWLTIAALKFADLADRGVGRRTAGFVGIAWTELAIGLMVVFAATRAIGLGLALGLSAVFFSFGFLSEVPGWLTGGGCGCLGRVPTNAAARQIIAACLFLLSAWGWASRERQIAC